MTNMEFGHEVHTSLNDLRYHAINDAEDLMQETKLRVIANREKFRTGSNLKDWLYIIMRYSFCSKYQRDLR